MELSVDAFGGEEVLAPGLGGPKPGLRPLKMLQRPFSYRLRRPLVMSTMPDPARGRLFSPVVMRMIAIANDSVQ